mgnify:CR=1 FL=1
MDTFESYFEKLDGMYEKEAREKLCCELEENYCVSEGVVICKSCNNVINNIVDSPEWRNYKSSSGNPTRCGMPVNQLLPQSSVGSFISTRGSRGYSMNKVRKYQQWGGMPYSERTLLKVFQEISRVSKQAGIPEMIIKEAHVLYKNNREERILQ